jgi:CBS domain-containing protein
MGEQNVSLANNKAQLQSFVRNLLKDIQALELMLKDEVFENNIRRIGAEQEMCLVNTKNHKPAPICMEVIEAMGENCSWLETELAKFNLETNLNPRVFENSCLNDMENEIREYLGKIDATLEQFDAKIALTGILPTIQKFNLELESLTPKKRYRALMDSIIDQLEGNTFELKLEGIDELHIRHNSPMIEAANTSFQVHLQVNQYEFVKMYNIAQAIAGPVLAISTNSPLVFGRRLWHESRIALFQQALDTRITKNHLREKSPRVQFGKDWLQESLLELYQEDISRFRVLMTAVEEQDSLETYKKGEIPKLKALQVHNSTVYRWNRACYGISGNGMPHLRIECRILPAGPTPQDEIANAAFWLGLMVGMSEEVEDIRDHLSFADVNDNFKKAAKFGIDTKFNWTEDRKISAPQLILEELLPIAKKGLEKQGINKEDIEKYLGIIEKRTQKHMTGARWILRSFTNLKKGYSREEAGVILTSHILRNQNSGMPIHEWPELTLSEKIDYKPSNLVISEFMNTDFLTVYQEDIIEMVVQIMKWKDLEFIPVENKSGHLVGVVTKTQILHFLSNKDMYDDTVCVEDIMEQNPAYINSTATLKDANQLMQEEGVNFLPVVNDKELIGVLSKKEFRWITKRLIADLES